MTVRDIFMVNEAGGTPPVASSYWAVYYTPTTTNKYLAIWQPDIINSDANKNIYTVFHARAVYSGVEKVGSILLKLDEDGNKVFDISKNVVVTTTDSNFAYSVFVSSSGDIYYGGLHSATTSRIVFVKLNSSGNVVFSKVFPGVSNLQSCALDSSGNIYIVGRRAASGSNFAPLILKLDSNGNTVWAKTYGNTATGSREFQSVKIDSLGYIYCVGLAQGGCALVKYDPSGNIVWEKVISASFYQAITIDSSNNIYYCSAYTPDGYSRGLLIKFDSSGNVIWERFFDDVGACAFNAVTVDSSGNVYCVGTAATQTFGSAYKYGCIAKYTSSGTLQWSRYIRSLGGELQLRGVKINANGAICVAGYPSVNYYFAACQLPSDGSLTGTYPNTVYINGSGTSGISTTTITTPTYANTGITFNSSNVTLVDYTTGFNTTKDIF